MAKYFVNGGAPNYPGVSATTAEQVATHIHNALVTQLGWELVSGGPSSLPMRIRSTESISGIKAFFEFAVSGNNLSVQAIDGNTLAPTIGTASSQLSPWIIDTTSRIWISGDEYGWIISVTSSSSRVTIYGGWPIFEYSNRTPYATSWALGRLAATTSSTSTATAGYAGVIYRNASGTRFASLPVGINANPLLSGSDTSNNNKNNGRSTEPELAPNYHRSPNGEFNGFVRFACTGLSGFTSGAIKAVNTGSTIRYYMACGVSPTSNAGEAGFYVDEVSN